jgi:hypothetical protein
MNPLLLSQSISKKQPQNFSSSKFVASTVITQKITSKTTFVQANTSSFKESMQKLTGVSNLDLEKFPITMTSTQAIAKVSGGNVETIGTRKQHDNTFGGLLPKPFSDLLFTNLPLSFMEEDIFLMFGSWR